MSETPETDSILKGRPNSFNVNTNELLDLCRKMEKERDHWKEECKHQWKHLSQAEWYAIKIQVINWGPDGDCGADNYARLIEEECGKGMTMKNNE